MLKSATKLALILLIWVLCLSVAWIVVFNVTAEPVVTWMITLFWATVWAVV